MPIQIYFDHRVLDGQAIHRLCVDLESTLIKDIVEELNAPP